MTFRLVGTGWRRELRAALRADTTALRIICPFIKTGALTGLLEAGYPAQIHVITRFNLTDFADGVSDISALRLFLDVGARVRGVRNLHAKLYLFGESQAIVTSANLTHAALKNNHEFGLVSQDSAIIATCLTYFDSLWKRGGTDLTAAQIANWDDVITQYRAKGGRPIPRNGLRDFGVDAGIAKPPPVLLPPTITDASQSFVKFLGEADHRLPLSYPIFKEIERSGCHWAVAYPATKRPRIVKDDAVIYIARLTHHPNDIRVFGRAIGMRHMPGRDDATTEDIARRQWKSTWSRYIRVHHAEFVAGTLANGVSLNKLMDALDSNSFAPTKRNQARGEGNTDPRRAYRQQAAVELSDEGASWLGESLQSAFDRHGKVPQDALDTLDWPTIP